jgi:hypothetical protein
VCAGVRGRPDPNQAELTDVAGRRLGTPKSNVSAPGRSAEGKQFRRTVYKAKRKARKLNPNSGPKGIEVCGRRAAWEPGPDGQPRKRVAVELRVSEDGRASWGGILRCASPHVCPTCALLLSRSRSDELEYLAAAHLTAGRGAYTVALTIPHDLHDRLQPMLRAVSGAWRRVKSGRAWLSFRERIGYQGDVRASETTVGPRHGWHPHLHVLLFVDHPTTDAERASIEDWLFERWSIEAERAGLPRPERWAELPDGSRKGLGVNVQELRTPEGATYIARAGLASVAGDIASLTGKVANRGNRTIWQLLVDASEDCRSRDARLWREWAVASKGVRALTWACRKLRAEYGLSGPATDEELAAAADEAAGDVAAVVSSDVWESLVRLPGWELQAFEIAEDRGAAAFLAFVQRCCYGWGKRKPPPWWRQEWNP